MSGTSLDGLDIASCLFVKDGKWKGHIEKAITIPYPESWLNMLKHLMSADAATLARAHVDFGHYIGKQVQEFIEKIAVKPDLISSHGHTVFHQPQNKFTVQIGDGNALSAQTSLPVVFDFRSLDVALGGQGAPLVPIGDRLLFGEYEYCLNLGGIANISFEYNNNRVAFDVCPVNMILNLLAGETGLPFDDKGQLAAVGEVHIGLLKSLNDLEYYRIEGVKTLGREWFIENLLPLFEQSKIDLKDQLRTAIEHIAYQIAMSTNEIEGGKILVTGGGALNDFLISRIRKLSNAEIFVPEEKLIHYKEAFIFAFLGVLRLRNEINCLSSVTGASRDSSAGVVVK